MRGDVIEDTLMVSSKTEDKNAENIYVSLLRLCVLF